MSQVLWLLDRFGLPGSYRKIWLRLLTDAGIKPSSVVAESLHNVMKRKLLMKYGTRKAPSWIPDEQPAIVQHINWLIEKHQPRAVVLASPESLACIGLHAEFATLHNLRGSVYWRLNLPHIVLLPMSAWNTLVSQKEIGAANYGFESQEALVAGQQGEIRQGVDGSGTSQSGDRARWNGTLDSGNSRAVVTGNVSARDSGAHHFGAAARSVDDDDGGELETGDEESREGAGGLGPEEESDSDSGELDSGDLDSSSGDAGGSGVDGEIDDPDPDDFFYEPVLSPVGRFTLTADVMKLKRILDSGRNANGPTEPLVLKYR